MITHLTNISDKRLCEAITSGALSYHVQPIFEATTRRLIAAEILARWYDDNGTLVPINEYLQRLCALEWTAPYCAQLGIERMQIGQALWRQFAIPIHFNIVAETLLIPDRFDQLSRHLRDSTLPLSALVIEVSEQNLLSADRNTLEATSERLEALISSAPGITVALDDFGIALNNLDRLRCWQIDCIKFDRRFIQGLENNTKMRHIVRHMRQLAEDLEVMVIAEGIETAEEENALIDLGVRYHQGFFRGTPMPLLEFQAHFSTTYEGF